MSKPCDRNNGKLANEHELLGAPVEVRSVREVKNPEELLRYCYPAFGAAYVRRIYEILDLAIGRGVPLIISVAGPVTVSNQHRAWLNDLIEAGWVAYISVTDAICYHDGHDSLERFATRPIREVPIEGKDAELKAAGVIRVTNTGFDEQILFDQDRMITMMLRQPELQRRMTGTEFRNLLGKYYDAQERAFGIRPGLLSTCWRAGVPVFVGAPSDGSVFLNSVKLWAWSQLGRSEHKFELDLHAEVFESCAYHYWGLTASESKQIAILILGGGVPKNFSLQPEPTLSQIFRLDGITGYEYDVQIVGAPVTQGDLTGCKPDEAVTWGKVDEHALGKTTESFQTDYTTIMPLLAWALLEKRERLFRLHQQMGDDLFYRHPEARGYLRASGQLRLFDRRKELVTKLMEKIGEPENIERIEETLDFPLQLLARAKD